MMRLLREIPAKKWFLPAFAFGIFLLSRAWLMTWPDVISDTSLYYQLSMRTNWANFVIYRDYAFAYPTLSWLAVKWPGALGSGLSFENYRFYFRLQLCVIEVVLAALLFWSSGKSLGSYKAPSKTLLIYTFLSLCMGNLLYDRIDLLMVFSMILIFVFWQRTNWKTKLGNDFGYIVGFFVKLIPIGLWPFQLVESFHRRSFHRFRAAMGAATWAWLPLVCVGGLWALDQWYTPGMIDALALHTVRGIQIESLWASPYLLAKLTGFNDAVQIVMFMGAHEIDSQIVDPIYILAAKFAGFAVLGLLFCYYAWRKVQLSDLRTRAGFFLLFIFCFLVFQRVLSTQFFIWATPFLAIWLGLRWNWFVALVSGAQYVLTYILFGQTYLDMVKFDRGATLILVSRNVCTFALFLYFAYEFWRQCEKSPQKSKKQAQLSQLREIAE